MTNQQRKHLKSVFLGEFAKMGNISAAARAAGIERTTVYLWQEHDNDFAEAFKVAEIASTERLEAEAYRRAHDGVEREKRAYHDGLLVDSYVEQHYSDTLLIFLLKARAPEKYRENIHVETEEKVSLDQARKVLRVGATR